MLKEKLIAITERNLKKAQISLDNHYNRSGITEQERENLKAKVEYNQIILNLISKGSTKYQQAKERARNKAIEWQNDYYNHNYSYEEMVAFQSYYEKLGRKYGLLREFRENGII